MVALQLTFVQITADGDFDDTSETSRKDPVERIDPVSSRGPCTLRGTDAVMFPSIRVSPDDTIRMCRARVNV